MTKGEFNSAFRILVGECYIPKEDLAIWAEALIDQDYADVMRNLQQYRDAHKHGIRLVPDPQEVRFECEHYHGHDKYVWLAIQDAINASDEIRYE